MIQELDNLARACRDLVLQAADEAGNLTAVARKTGISRRRIGYLVAGQRRIRQREALALLALIARQL